MVKGSRICKKENVLIYLLMYKKRYCGKNRKEHLFSPPLSFAPSFMKGFFLYFSIYD